MLPQKQFQQLLATVSTLDEKSLAVLEEVIGQYLTEEAGRLDALKKKQEQIKDLRAAIKEQDEKKIATLQAQLHAPLD